MSGMLQPSYEEFARLSRHANLIPVYQEFLLDFETPLSFFSRLDKDRYAFLLESVEGSERWARYSFLGTRPYLVFKASGNEVEILRGHKKQTLRAEQPLARLLELLKENRVAEVPGLPPFFGGAIGYVAYDAVRDFYRIPLPLKAPDPIPEIFFVLVQTLVVFDNLKHTIRVIDNVRLDGGPSLKEAYRRAAERIQRLVSSLQRAERAEARAVAAAPLRVEPASNLDRSAFAAAVRKAKAYIEAGDIIQAVLCQRLEVETAAEPFEIYRALRFVNPSPYMFYLELEDLRLIGASPETMVRLTGDTIELRPIAGTRRRGASAAEDLALEEELRADPKERAEHIMLVDLGRNDVGRVAEIGSVEVNELMAVERYSHVMHLVSNVRGKLAPGKGPLEVFVSCFPAGTVSGAPKIRAMQIISELEGERRGVYAGAVGYFGFNGNLDTCIAIRTIAMRGRRAAIHAGAGIVADSDPDKEYQETLNKAGAMLKAIALAESWKANKKR